MRSAGPGGDLGGGAERARHRAGNPDRPSDPGPGRTALPAPPAPSCLWERRGGQGDPGVQGQGRSRLRQAGARHSRLPPAANAQLLPARHRSDIAVAAAGRSLQRLQHDVDRRGGEAAAPQHRDLRLARALAGPQRPDRVAPLAARVRGALPQGRRPQPRHQPGACGRDRSPPPRRAAPRHPQHRRARLPLGRGGGRRGAADVRTDDRLFGRPDRESRSGAGDRRAASGAGDRGCE